MYKGSKLKIIAAFLVLSSAQQVMAETVRLRPADPSTPSVMPSGALPEGQEDSQSNLLKEAQKMREQGVSNSEKIQELQDRLREAYTALERESTKAAYRGEGAIGEIAIGEWKIDPTKSLRENMMLWRFQAERVTKQEIHFVWELPGPVELSVPAIFYGNWRDALWQLSMAFQQNDWDIQIEVAKTNNVVIFKPYRN